MAAAVFVLQGCDVTAGGVSLDLNIDPLAGASGRLDVSFEKSGTVECADVLCLEETILDPFVLEGTLTVPKPR